MKTVTATELRTNVYQLLDEVLNSGSPIEVKRGDRTLRILPVEKPDKLQSLVHRPDVISGRSRGPGYPELGRGAEP